MARSPLIYSLPPGTTPQQPNTVIQSSVWNAAMDDIAQTFNTAQPIEYGGTAAVTATDALANLGGTPLSIIDAKGDLIVGTSDNVVARQPVGANGRVIIADSSQVTGLFYAERGGIFTFSSGQQTQADGVTYYIGAAQVGTAPSEMPLRSPAVGLLKNMYCQATSTSSGTRTYTLFKNGSPTSLTCFASGTSTQCQDATNSVGVGVGDYLEVRVVTSGGSSPPVKTSITLELFKTSA